MPDLDRRSTNAARDRSPIDPTRPALEYLTLDRPRFQVATDRDTTDNSWSIDEPGLYVTCRICGIPVAALTYSHSLWENLPKMVWGLDGPPGDPFGGELIGDISAGGESTWTWDEAIAEIRDRLGNTSLAGACAGTWYDLLPNDDDSDG